MLDHDPGVGGRFSVLTNVGLLPAAVLGLDIGAIRAGAAAALAPVLDRQAAGRSAGRGRRRARGRARADSGKPHRGDDGLCRPARALHPLVRAALGRKPRQGRQGHDADRRARPGRPAQPAAALHRRPARQAVHRRSPSAPPGTGPRIDAELAKLAGEPDFAGKTIGDLVAAQGRATAETLAKNGCPVRTIHLDTARRDEPRRAADAFHAGDDHRRASARRRCRSTSRRWKKARCWRRSIWRASLIVIGYAARDG